MVLNARGSPDGKPMADWQDRLAEAMQARGLSGGALARKTGFTAQYINSLRNKARGGRLPLETVRRLSHALAVSVEWLGTGSGSRERPSDVLPVLAGEGRPSERYPGRAEAIALLEATVEPPVIAALRASCPDDPAFDPGRDFWIQRARELVRDLRRIQADPELAPTAGPLEPLETRRA